MTSFGYSKHKQTIIFHDNVLELKINFDPIIRWRGLDKINGHKYIIYTLSMTIGLHVYAS
jgi:hypothetical protein